MAVTLVSSILIRDGIISHDQVRSRFHRPGLTEYSRFYGSEMQSGKKKTVWSVERHHVSVEQALDELLAAMNIVRDMAGALPDGRYRSVHIHRLVNKIHLCRQDGAVKNGNRRSKRYNVICDGEIIQNLVLSSLVTEGNILNENAIWGVTPGGSSAKISLSRTTHILQAEG